MNAISFIPKVCKGDDATFAGQLTIVPPTFDQKYEYLENCGLQLKEDGTVDLSQLRMQTFKMIRKMVAASKEHYASVDLLHKATGKKFTSFDEISTCADCEPILIEVATALMTGFKLGNG